MHANLLHIDKAKNKYLENYKQPKLTYKQTGSKSEKQAPTPIDEPPRSPTPSSYSSSKPLKQEWFLSRDTVVHGRAESKSFVRISG